MGRKRKMSSAEKASARWDDGNAEVPDPAATKQGDGEEPANGDHFILSLVLIGIVAIAAFVFIAMQGTEFI